MKHRRLLLRLAGASLMLLLTSCASVDAPTPGFIYSNVKHGTDVGDGNAAATKTGKACATSMLGWVATGDASIEAAARDGGISRNAYVDHTSKVIMGVYGEYCTVVHGT